MKMFTAQDISINFNMEVWEEDEEEERGAS